MKHGRGKKVLFYSILLSMWFTLDGSWGEDRSPRIPSAKDKCPVCGMFVHKYPDWSSQIIFKGGSVVFFDGAKDLFRCYNHLKKFIPGKTVEDVDAIYVTEYYGMKPINALDAFFVIGSDVFGPMGRELIPVGGRADAEEFLKDHKGKQILGFKEITPAILESLD